MVNFIRIKKNNESEKLEFFQLDLFEIIKNNFGYRYVLINKRGYYIKLKHGVFQRVNFREIVDETIEYLESNFDSFEIPKKFNLADFMNVFYSTKPVNQSYARVYLKIDDEELSNEEINYIIDN